MDYMTKLSCMRVLVVAGALLASSLLSGVDRVAGEKTGRKTVVLELFTSEGCSSCPPADELLARLSQERRSDGIEIIPLGMHVDYWNFQGWTDRFSSSAYSKRQLKYAERFRLQSAYTPQLVIDGAVEAEGADSRRAHELINQAAARPMPAQISASLEGDKLKIDVTAQPGSQGEVMLAYTEDNLSSRINAGENNGRELRHTAVVRELQSLGTLRSGAFAIVTPLKLKEEWKRDNLRAVIFLQEPDGGNIEGAVSLTLRGGTAKSQEIRRTP